ncbi:MAG TPA: hypothetical protein VID68_02280 [Solirubrobacteraceae bacterium]
MLYGCSGARRTRLGALRGTRPAPGTRIALFALAGRFAGVDTAQMGIDTFDSTVSLRDLRNPQLVVSAPATNPERRPESFITVSALCVNRDGALAWIGRRSAIGVPEPTYELHLLTGGLNRIEATGAAKLANLTLTATTLSWTDATGRHSRHL